MLFLVQAKRGGEYLYHRVLGHCYQLSLSNLSMVDVFFSPRGLLSLACKALRKLLASCGDPMAIVKTPYGLTFMPLSHELPAYYSRFPLYDSVINRLASSIRGQHGRLVCVDVGGNIGDSALCARLCHKDIYLLIEPNPIYRKCAATNLRVKPAAIEIVDSLVGAVDAELGVSELASHGTAKFTLSDQDSHRQVTSIDTLVFNRPHLAPNFIKIDTDGHDMACLQGARQTIKRFRPVVMFEADSFGDSDYCQRLLDCLSVFSEAGYERMMVYSNIGHLVWTGDVDDVASIARLIFYHLTSKALYYDFVIVPNNDSFFDKELLFFADLPEQETLRQAARSCIDLMVPPNGFV